MPNSPLAHFHHLLSKTTNNSIHLRKQLSTPIHTVWMNAYLGQNMEMTPWFLSNIGESIPYIIALRVLWPKPVPPPHPACVCVCVTSTSSPALTGLLPCDIGVIEERGLLYKQMATLYKASKHAIYKSYVL